MPRSALTGTSGRRGWCIFILLMIACVFSTYTDRASTGNRPTNLLIDRGTDINAVGGGSGGWCYSSPITRLHGWLELWWWEEFLSHEEEIFLTFLIGFLEMLLSFFFSVFLFCLKIFKNYHFEQNIQWHNPYSSLSQWWWWYICSFYLMWELRSRSVGSPHTHGQAIHATSYGHVCTERVGAMN